jgi:hypothetical protein
MKSDGEAVKVQCDLEQPLPVGKEINWVLSYDLVDSFDSEREEVCMSCFSEGRIGALHVLFSPEDPPNEFSKAISKNGINQESEDIRLNHEAPEVYWRFPVKFGLEYAFRWKWQALLRPELNQENIAS